MNAVLHLVKYLFQSAKTSQDRTVVIVSMVVQEEIWRWRYVKVRIDTPFAIFIRIDGIVDGI